MGGVSPSCNIISTSLHKPSAATRSAFEEQALGGHAFRNLSRPLGVDASHRVVAALRGVAGEAVVQHVDVASRGGARLLLERPRRVVRVVELGAEPPARVVDREIAREVGLWRAVPAGSIAEDRPPCVVLRDRRRAQRAVEERGWRAIGGAEQRVGAAEVRQCSTPPQSPGRRTCRASPASPRPRPCASKSSGSSSSTPSAGRPGANSPGSSVWGLRNRGA